MKLFGTMLVVLLLLLLRATTASADAAASVDSSDLAQRVLAQHWRELSVREQDEFARLFRGMVTRSVERIRARVNADIVIDGESLVSNYRSQFHAILGTSSVAGLLERMRGDAAREEAKASNPETTRGRVLASLLVGVAVSGRGTR